MSDTQDIIERFQDLNINQQLQVANLISSFTTNNQRNSSEERVPNSRFVSSNNVPLAIGDTVRILNNRKTGKQGDLAIVDKFNKLYVAIKLKKNNSIAQRAPKYLEYIE